MIAIHLMQSFSIAHDDGAFANFGDVRTLGHRLHGLYTSRRPWSRHAEEATQAAAEKIVALYKRIPKVIV